MGFGSGIGEGAEKLLMAMLGIVIVLGVLAGVWSYFATSAETIANDTTIPLHGLFSPTGVLGIVFVAVVLIGVVYMAMKKR
jgi:hypothetical protein